MIGEKFLKVATLLIEIVGSKCNEQTTSTKM